MSAPEQEPIRAAAGRGPEFLRGRNERVIGALEATLGSHARVLNRHFDAQHNRCVFTIAAEPEKLVEALVAGAEHALDLIDLRGHQGLHPHIGALDVCPAVWQIEERHDDARAAARRAAEGISELGIPVFFYGELASGPERRERAFFRGAAPRSWRAGWARGARARSRPVRAAPERRGDPGDGSRAPGRLQRRARHAESGDRARRRRRAAGGRRRTSRRPGAGIAPRGRALSGLGERPRPSRRALAKVVSEISRLAAEHGARPVEAELVGLAPEVALEGYPDEPPIRDFDPKRDVIENVWARFRSWPRRGRSAAVSTAEPRAGGSTAARPAAGREAGRRPVPARRAEPRSAIRERRIPELEQLAEEGRDRVGPLLCPTGDHGPAAALLGDDRDPDDGLLRADGLPAGSVPLPAPSAQGGREAPRARAAADRQQQSQAAEQPD